MAAIILLSAYIVYAIFQARRIQELHWRIEKLEMIIQEKRKKEED